jgi:hypothetical protein
MDGQAMVFLEEAGFNVEAVRALAPGEFIARNLNSGVEQLGRVF